MKQNETNLVPKSSEYFYCIDCDYNTVRKGQYNRHLLTLKQQNVTKWNKKSSESSESSESSDFLESLEKNMIMNVSKYNNRITLWRHKKNA